MKVSMDNYGGAKAMDAAINARREMLEEAWEKATCSQCLHFVRCDLKGLEMVGWCRMNEEFFFGSQSVGELGCEDYDPWFF